MEKIYWISNYSELGKLNEEIEKNNGHVIMISSASAAKNDSSCAHAFIVVEYKNK